MALAFDVLLASAGVTLALVILVWTLWRSRLTPQQRELRREFRRRRAIARDGRIIEATVNDIQDDAIYYSYELQGVVYHTSQDVSVFRDALPVARERLVGPAACKYLVTNPANSLVICEEWSGLKRVTEGNL
ncbi:MAG: hypothetical protein K2X03_29765 [Bryobacteraceae bacterium]|nr:hypothetical protein [Bryobacteraceae bacterium]